MTTSPATFTEKALDALDLAASFDVLHTICIKASSNSTEGRPKLKHAQSLASVCRGDFPEPGFTADAVLDRIETRLARRGRSPTVLLKLQLLLYFLISESDLASLRGKSRCAEIAEKIASPARAKSLFGAATTMSPLTSQGAQLLSFARSFAAAVEEAAHLQAAEDAELYSLARPPPPPATAGAAIARLRSCCRLIEATLSVEPADRVVLSHATAAAACGAAHQMAWHAFRHGLEAAVFFGSELDLLAADSPELAEFCGLLDRFSTNLRRHAERAEHLKIAQDPNVVDTVTGEGADKLLPLAVFELDCARLVAAVDSLSHRVSGKPA
jgi:hypothetical protein